MSGDNNNSGQGFSLSGGPAEALPSSWARPASARRVGRVGDWNNAGGQSSSRSSSGGGGSGPRIASLRDLNAPATGPPPSVGGAGGGHDSDDDDDERRGPESWFAGGERSGISVQNPDSNRGVPGGDMVRDLLRRAAEAGPALPPTAAGRAGAFSGGGHMLGSDEIESSFVPDPSAATDPDQETAIRHLTFWRDGFTVEQGELMRYDDPSNETILAEINSGRAPPSILNVLPGQPVELRVERQIDTDYVAPKRAGFSGSGNRLGAPVPGESASSSSSMPGNWAPAPAASSSSASAGSSIGATRFEVDQSLPTTSIQIRLADGTRIVCRMNLTHTVLDIRNFINAARPENLTRPYTIGTTFPNKTLEDNTQSVEAAGLKNSVIVQRWA